MMMRRVLTALQIALTVALCSSLQFTIADADVTEPASIDSAQTSTYSSASTQNCCDQLRRIGFNSTLPVVIVNLMGNTLQKYVPDPATMCTCGASGGTDFDAVSVGVKVHGSSSSRNDKKSMTFKVGTGTDTTSGDDTSGARRRLMQASNTQAVSTAPKRHSVKRNAVYPPSSSNDGQDAGPGMSQTVVSFLGMPPGAKWMLYADGEIDRSVGIRDVLTYAAGNQMGNWAPRTVWCEVFVVVGPKALNMSDYTGLYVGMEHIQRQKQRVDIQRLKPTVDMSGGYIWGYEHGNLGPNDTTFNTSSGLVMPLHYPSYPKKSVQEADALAWITGFMDEVESAVLNSTRDWRDLVDELAFIDYFLATELTRNPDGYRGSIYMHKDQGGKLIMGPLWDYNEAWGACCGYPIEGYKHEGAWAVPNSQGSAISPAGWRFNDCDEPGRCLEDTVDGVSRYYRKVWAEEPAFRQATNARWVELRKKALNDDFFIKTIDDAVTEVHEAVDRNNLRWTAQLASTYFPTYRANYAHQVQKLLNWALARASWMDAALQDAGGGGMGVASAWKQGNISTLVTASARNP